MKTYMLMLLAVFAVTAGWQSTAFAQSTRATDELDEIVVTASRRGAVSLQDLPISVSAIAADSISQQGVDGIVDIIKSVPSINVIQLGPGQTQFTIRGVASGAFAPTETGDRPLVAVYFDDVPISIQGYNPDLKVYDLERVEVLRGPQGTLFGAGSMAGTVRYITKKPSVDAFDGSVEAVLSTTAEAGDPNWNIRGSINAPISDNVAFLGAVYHGDDAGFIDNTGLAA
ncbi:MAG: TonB-dependent receptor plug domain-containing protein, partial [Pseudomonadota bacterium]